MSNTIFSQIATFYTTTDAEIACGLLRDNGIEATLQDDHSANLLPSGLFGGVRLMVPTDDVDVARRLLEEMPPDEAE